MLRELAEYPNSFVEPTPGSERIETDRFTLCLTLRGATVQRQRFAARELDAVVEEVRALLRGRGRTRTQWEIGSEATPHGLADTLRARGFTRDEEPWALAVALTEPPAELEPAAGLRVAQVVSAEDFADARGVQDVALSGRTTGSCAPARVRGHGSGWRCSAAPPCPTSGGAARIAH